MNLFTIILSVYGCICGMVLGLIFAVETGIATWIGIEPFYFGMLGALIAVTLGIGAGEDIEKMGRPM